MPVTANYGFQMLDEGQAQAHATVNQAITQIDSTLASLPAGQAAAAVRQVANIATLKALPKGSTTNAAVIVLGYAAAGDGGGGTYRVDLADTTSADNASTLIVATDGGRWKLVSAIDGQTLTVTAFGAKGDGVADDTAALQRARDFAAATKRRLVFPAGTYKYSVSPNWGYTDADIVAQGKVVLQYTGTGNAVIIDAGTTTASQVFNLRFGADNPFHVNALSTATNGVYVRSIHHSVIGVNVHGCGSASAGLYVQFAVCTCFYVTVSVNQGGWYGGAKPKYGIALDLRLAGETTSYCYFPNAIIEGTQVGIYLVATLGNLFTGGTSEGCTDVGVQAMAGANYDRFIGQDWEVNTNADVWCQGNGLEFLNCEGLGVVTLGTTAKRCRVIGGNYRTLNIDPGAIDCDVRDVRYNRIDAPSGYFSDSGTRTSVDNARNAATGAQFRSGTLTTGAIANVTTGAEAVFNVTVPGAKIGDFAAGSIGAALAGLTVSASVTAVDNVAVVARNVTGATIAIPASTIIRARAAGGLQ